MTQEQKIKLDPILKRLSIGIFSVADAMTNIDAIVTPSWKRYPENVPEVGDHTVTLEIDGNLIVDRDTWATGGYWQFYPGHVIAFMESPSPYNPEKT